MKTNRRFSISRGLTRFTEDFGLSRTWSLVAVGLTGLVIGFAVFWFFYSAPPRTLTITSGPPGSPFAKYAERYRTNLANNGVTLKILPSQGSVENLQRLENPALRVDIGFVQSGISDGTNSQNLMSLGNIAYEPLYVFYRGTTAIKSLAELKGKRLAIGAAGSGAHSLALTLLQTNGIADDGTTRLLDLEADDAAQALLAGTADAVFMMSDSASSQTMHKLLRSPEIRLMNFEQADAYTRKIHYLNKLRFPEGSFDFGKNLPPQDVWLIGPTVELVARPGLNAAVSDLLLEAAQDVHGSAAMLQNHDEFPNPTKHEFTISPDASRYYTSGKTFMYRQFQHFWMASLVKRALLIFGPMLLVLIPALRLIPSAFKWRFQLRFYRWYQILLVLERELAKDSTPEKRDKVKKRLDEIEKEVKHMRVPASFADQFYGLRGHIDYVREQLANHGPAAT